MAIRRSMRRTDGIELVPGKIMPGLRAQQEKDLLQYIAGALDRRSLFALLERARILDIGNQCRRHLLRRQHKIHQAGGYRALRHAGIFRATRATAP